MRSMRWACVLVALLFTAVVDAGQIYGTIVSDGKGVASASIEIKCGTAEPVTGSKAAIASTWHRKGSARSRCRPTWGAPRRRSFPARIQRSTTSTW